MKPQSINLDFISKWEKVYDSHENDEKDYVLLCNKIADEFKINNSITKETFIKLIEWKSHRVKGKIDWNKYESIYEPVIGDLKHSEDYKFMLHSLVELKGIGVPVASTILHFIFPDTFPIIDIRTTESLNYFGLWHYKTISENNYWLFFKILTDIKNSTGSTLREIDRALFSFHKVYLKPGTLHKYNLKEPELCKKSDYRLKSNKTTDDTNSLEYHIHKSYDMNMNEFSSFVAEKYISNSEQKEIFLKDGVWMKVRLNYIAGLILTAGGKTVFTPKEIRTIIRKEVIPSISDLDDNSLSGLILTQDVHKYAKREYNNGFYCLEKTGRGQYKFIGFK